MATTTTTNTPFLGCKISLISKSEIRYEGILYTIDPKESTIALAKVRSFGTEDRPTERQVPPREEVFEYIIFRAGDIKDLTVDDPNNSIAPALTDPAIIQAHSTSNPSVPPMSSGTTFPVNTFQESDKTCNISANSGQSSSGPELKPEVNVINPLTNCVDNSSMTADSQQHTQSSRSDRRTQELANHKTNKENESRYVDHRRGQTNSNQNYTQKHWREGSGLVEQRQSNSYRQYQSHSQPHQTGHRFGGYNRQYNHYSDERRPPMQSRPQSQRGAQNRGPNRGPKESLKFESDYDFDKAEEEFKQMDEKMTSLKLEVNSDSEQTKDDKQSTVDAHQSVNDESTNDSKDESEANCDHFYDKEKSFFDTISCEAIEREKGNIQRMNWKFERKLNSETFGVNLRYRRMGFGRGRGRGGYGGYGNYAYRSYSGGYRYNRGRGGGGDTRNRFNGQQLNDNN